MARRPTAKRITRRNAVALLGAGAVMAATRPEPVRAQKPSKECAAQAPVRRYGQPTRRYLMADTCCEESRNAVLVGVEEPSFKPTQTGKMHLKALHMALLQEKLAEYCVMIWGLTEAQVNQIRAEVPKQLNLGDEIKQP
jgi:hypothetical protein